MKLKPKSSVRNPRALLYKRFIGLEKSATTPIVYHTTSKDTNTKAVLDLYWTFDTIKGEFQQITREDMPTAVKVANIGSYEQVLLYKDTMFMWTGLKWTDKGISISTDLEERLQTGTIGQYQVNKYYYCGSFDYMIRGSSESDTTQYIKGNIIPLHSMTIKYYCDDIKVQKDDLVVIDGKLWSVESTETSRKMQPKPLKIYFATLNSVL